MNAMMDPILEKMSNMPGIEPKSLIKSPPFDRDNLASFFGGLLNPQNSNSKMSPSPLPKVDRLSNTPRFIGGNLLNLDSYTHPLIQRHDPGENMMMGRGLWDMDSRLLGEAELKHPKLAEYLERSQPNMVDGHLRLHVTGGGKVLQENNATSVLPAWRKTFVHILGAGQEAGNVDSMRELAPNMGAYVNEVSNTASL
jgi:hypothetical protein